jgi:hypothetical protein
MQAISMMISSSGAAPVSLLKQGACSPQQNRNPTLSHKGVQTKQAMVVKRLPLALHIIEEFCVVV